ncbi:hypothetical protein KUV22_05740 [Microbulbifer agarilyticus]|uniref:hypothetical protein n=1 Tax=Microbulbifer agarilyticus TaxID=260552 RepID=UPI001C98CE72|nr:hypothetical protein [Microbulbifer agarilyticus]MBY6189919.1 hypothetical protein [Microbulbifer agarilyticus]
MGLTWDKSLVAGGKDGLLGDGVEFEVYSSVSEADEEDSVNTDMIEALDYALSFLDRNVKDESRFFLVGWDAASSTLMFSVTDDTKQMDSPIMVRCHFVGLSGKLASDSERESAVEAYEENVRFWCKEHLSTSSAFTQYSLIALFVDEDRARAGLL